MRTTLSVAARDVEENGAARAAPRRVVAAGPVLRPLVPIMTAVFLSFLVIGIALPVIPLHVHQGLGLGAFVVGVVAGSQFAMAFVTRFWAGSFADRRGAKLAVVVGLFAAAVAGGFYLVSLAFVREPSISAAILIAGRGILGAGESCIITGALAWGVKLAGPTNTGKVMAWVGMAMYASYAVGAPLGTALYVRYGFFAIALATALGPLATLTIVSPLHAAPSATSARPSFTNVARAVWRPGTGLALSSLGYGAVMTFVMLLYADRGWPRGWLALTGFSVAFIVARAALGHLADRIGGAKVALVSVLVSAAGLALIWLAPGAALALVGAIINGLGYSLVYPGFGVEAVRCAPVESRGLAMATYTAFLDLALGIANPVLGLVGSAMGLGAVFLVSALVVLSSAVFAVGMLPSRRTAATRTWRSTGRASE